MRNSADRLEYGNPRSFFNRTALTVQVTKMKLDTPISWSVCSVLAGLLAGTLTGLFVPGIPVLTVLFSRSGERDLDTETTAIICLCGGLGALNGAIGSLHGLSSDRRGIGRVIWIPILVSLAPPFLFGDFALVFVAGILTLPLYVAGRVGQDIGGTARRRSRCASGPAGVTDVAVRLDRQVFFGPLAFTLTSMLADEIVAMLFCQDYPGHVPGYFLMFAIVLGAAVGGVLSFAARQIDRTKPGIGMRLGVLTIVLLCGGIGAVLGWIPGEALARSGVEREGVAIIRMWIGIGAAAGMCIGVLVAFIEAFLQRKTKSS